jgi:hypothetical protein
MPGVREWAWRRTREAAVGEVDQVAEVESDDSGDPEARILKPFVGPDGKPIPRFRRRTAADIAPPPPSRNYLQDRDYASRVDWNGDSLRRARARHASWAQRHSQATTGVVGWLAAGGHLGTEARDAFEALGRQKQLQHQAEANVTAGRAALDQARAAIAEGVRRALAGRADLPLGGPVVSARLELEGFKLVAELVQAAGPGVNQTWGRCVQGADWAEALRAAELLDSPDAEQAAMWLRGRVYPPVTPDKDPVAWL